MAAQLELLGIPLSTGRAGEGVRLLLGTDVLSIPGKIPNGTGDSTFLQDAQTSTRWLLPASMKAFDSRCSHQDPTVADGMDCAAVGTHTSCGMGCNRHPDRESRWRNLGQVSTYPIEWWTVADKGVWQDLHAMTTAMVTRASTSASGVDYDTLALVESAKNAYPVTQYTDRPFWIVNGTSQASMCEIVLGIRESEAAWKDDILSTRFAAAQSEIIEIGGDKFPHSKLWCSGASNVKMSSLCLAASNPIPDSRATRLGRIAGTTGLPRTL